MTAPFVRRGGRSTPEKLEEQAARRLMSALGFGLWHLSQSRATNQTAGLPDMLFTCPAKRLAVWYEAKSRVGKQSPAQKAFQADISACGHEYVVGPCDALVAWCESKGLVIQQPPGALTIPRRAS